MKKLNKKQKIIILVSVIILLILIAVIIGTNIIRNQITGEEYNVANGSSSNGNLLPEYIKAGITLGGVTGTLEDLDTSDATATAEDILWGKIAYAKGQRLVGTKVVTVKQGKESQKVFENNTNLIDDYGNNVKVPAGFKIASDSATSVTGGVVIEDVSAGDEYTKGSQFVWIPVGNIITEGNKIENLVLGRYDFSGTGTEKIIQTIDNWQDTSESVEIVSVGLRAKEIEGDYKAKNLKDFLEKATNSKGYYIGRYEAGDALAVDETHQRTENSPITDTVASKKGVYPYNNIIYTEASQLSRNMYIRDEFESDLVNSYAWDTATVFIQKFSGDTNYSRQPGKNTTGRLEKCGESLLANVTNGDEVIDRRCNIYDIAGNTWEISTESKYNVTNGNIIRGDDYYGDYGEVGGPASRAFIVRGESAKLDDASFRVILYL